MKESRVFELNQATAEQVLEAVTTFLRGEKSMEVQSVATPNGYLIQAAQADTLRTLSGILGFSDFSISLNGFLNSRLARTAAFSAPLKIW